MQIAQLASLATRDGQATGGLSVAMQAARLAYARQDELEADRIGVRYLQAAGYDPAGMLSFLETIHELDQHKRRYLPRGVVRPQYALTHPYAPERIRTVKEAIYGVADYLDYLNTAP
jgi:predicted Zn-dependent protease